MTIIGNLSINTSSLIPDDNGLEENRRRRERQKNHQKPPVFRSGPRKESAQLLEEALNRASLRGPQGNVNLKWPSITDYVGIPAEDLAALKNSNEDTELLNVLPSDQSANHHSDIDSLTENSFITELSDEDKSRPVATMLGKIESEFFQSKNKQSIENTLIQLEALEKHLQSVDINHESYSIMYANHDDAICSLDFMQGYFETGSYDENIKNNILTNIKTIRDQFNSAVSRTDAIPNVDGNCNPASLNVNSVNNIFANDPMLIKQSGLIHKNRNSNPNVRRFSERSHGDQKDIQDDGSSVGVIGPSFHTHSVEIANQSSLTKDSDKRRKQTLPEVTIHSI